MVTGGTLPSCGVVAMWRKLTSVLCQKGLTPIRPRDPVKFRASYPEYSQRVETPLLNMEPGVTKMLEHSGLSDVGNLAAVCRSADALGYGAMHVIDVKADRRPDRPTSRSSKGSEKWVDLQTWTSTADCVRFLRGQGRQVLVTHLDDKAIPISEVDWTKPTALILGNEVNGVSEEVVRLADATCAIPMSGFVQSVNVSVAAAIILHEAREARMRKQGHHSNLSPEQHDILLAVFLLRGTKDAHDFMTKLLNARHASGHANRAAPHTTHDKLETCERISDQPKPSTDAG